jgi:hypothetical protein
MSSALAVLGELEDGGGDGEVFLPRGHGGEALTFADGLWEVLLEELGHLRFGIEEVHLGRSAGLEEVDDAFGFDREMGEA